MLSTDPIGGLDAGRHPQLGVVRRMLVDRSCALLSLDIFDTILWRRVPRPTDVFAILGARLRAEGRLPGWVSDATFRRMRIDAEERARKRRDDAGLGTEVSLFDIWQAMPARVVAAADLDVLVKAEVELEREFTVVDLDVADLIRTATTHDVQVVLVSDTYFTDEHLARLLDRPEIGPLKQFRIFRSCQHGKDKATGLWEIVLAATELSADQVVHVGDNEIADHEVPAELGIRTVHYERLSEEFEAVLHREDESAAPLERHPAHLDPEHGDFGLTSLRAKTLQNGPELTPTATDVAWRYGASVLGPVFTGFAEWVAHTAHTSGTRAVWCPMREGELLSALVNRAAAVRGWDVTAKPIWLSRHVTSVAGLSSIDVDAVADFVRRSYRLPVRQLLAALRLRAGEVPALAAQLDTIIDTGEMAERVALALVEDPHLRNRLAVTTTATRERLIRSLRAAGALDGPDLVLVDVGWGGTIQAQLADVLAAADIGIAPAGLYLATDDRSIKTYRKGLRAEGYLAQAGAPRAVAGALTRSPEVIEQSVNALCGSLLDFAEDGSPVLGPVGDTPAQDAERTAVQEGITAFQAQWYRYVENADGRWPTLATSPAARARLGNVVTAALRHPSSQEASVFGNWQHEDNFGSSVVTKVLPDDLVAAIPYLSPADLVDLDMRDAFWPALIAASDVQLGAVARQIAAGHVDLSMFEPSGEPFDTRLQYRTLDDEWHEGPVRRVRINHNGLSFARMRLDADDVLDISLSIPGRPAIVRVDWIEARVIAGGHPRDPLRWDAPEHFAGLTYDECGWIGGNLLEFHSIRGFLKLPLAARAGAPVSSAVITVAFAMLPQSSSGLSPRMPRAPRLRRISGRLREEYQTRGPAGLAGGVARVALRRLGGPQ